MTVRERLLNVLYGKEIDRIPFSPFLAYYWDAQPASVHQKGFLKFYQEIGADYLNRGSHVLFDVIRKNCEINEKIEGYNMYIEYVTPVGKLYEEKKYVAEANTWFLTKHPVSTEEDFKTLIYILQNTELRTNIQGYEQDKKNVGDDGLLVPVISPETKTGFQALLEHWVGVENLNYALYDFPELVEEALLHFNRNSVKSVECSLESSAEAFIFWEDTTTTLLNPEQFKKYVLPEISQWSQMIHRENKILIHHACGLIHNIYRDMFASNVDFIESITPRPTGDVDMKEAFLNLPSEKGLIGGIDPVFFRGASIHELVDYATELLTMSKGKKFILSNSDSCPPDVQYEKFTALSKLVKNYKQ